MPEATSSAEPETLPERTESGRLDNFVDGAFAFAITLLVISGATLPRTVDALEHALRGVPAFAACFAQLAFLWHAHVQWRDAVRLTDHRSLQLSLLLVFFALIFVFPLHLVYAGLANVASGGALSPGVTIFTNTRQQGAAALFVAYGLSYACMAGTLWALYWHGARTATWLGRAEAIGVRVWVAVWAYVALIGLVSTVLALTLPQRLMGIPGMTYFMLLLIGPIAGRYRRRVDARLPP